MINTYIIIPTWNNAEYTTRCFASVAKSTSNYKIIWIDNGSDIDEIEIVRSFLTENDIPYIAIFNEVNLGFVKGTNQGMHLAIKDNIDYVVLLNNDTEVYCGWLERMIKVIMNQKNAGIVGPLASPSHGWQDINNLRKKRKEDFYNIPEYNKNPKSFSSIIKKQYDGESIEVYPNVAFFCTLISKKVLLRIGVLSEDFDLGLGDDDDYCSRALDAGFKIFLSKDVFIFHNHRTTFKKNFTDEEISEMGRRNAEILKDKHLRYRELIESGRPKDRKEFLLRLKKVYGERGTKYTLKYINWYLKEWKNQRGKSWLK